VDAYVTNKALDGLFSHGGAGEEKLIRENSSGTEPLALLQQVFGAVKK